MLIVRISTFNSQLLTVYTNPETALISVLSRFSQQEITQEGSFQW